MPDFAILVEGLVKRYGQITAVDGIDLEVAPGTVVGLLGPNGAGKTTTVRILTTILRPDAGRASVLGLDVATQAHAVRCQIGLAGQYAAVEHALTGRENLTMVGLLTRQPRRALRGRVDELLERFELTDAADRAVKTYSGGMRRRLDLAAALVHRPKILFLDEPTSGLDPRSRNELWSLIAGLVQDGTTVLLTTQYLEEADRLSERIVVIDRGHVIADGSAHELKRRLGRSIVEVRMPTRSAARAAARRLAALGTVEITDGRTVLTSVPDAGPAVADVVHALDGAGLSASSIDLRTATLEDVFLQITGDRPAPAA